jgi:hypothetical protein
MNIELKWVNLSTASTPRLKALTRFNCYPQLIRFFIFLGCPSLPLYFWIIQPLGGTQQMVATHWVGPRSHTDSMWKPSMCHADWPGYGTPSKGGHRNG